MNKAKKVVEFYVLCNKLKNIIRTGWIDWNVNRERLESVAEHVYGVQNLALAIWSEYGYKLDIKKVITMLAIHELEETIIGDLTMFQIDSNHKKELGHNAINQILGKLIKGEELRNLILKFDEKKSPEAQFASMCDKLECDLQAKIYGEENCVDLNNQENNQTALHPSIQKHLQTGKTWEEMWLLFSQEKYLYDANFLEVSNFALKNKIKKKDTNNK